MQCLPIRTVYPVEPPLQSAEVAKLTDDLAAFVELVDAADTPDEDYPVGARR